MTRFKIGLCVSSYKKWDSFSSISDISKWIAFVIRGFHRINEIKRLTPMILWWHTTRQVIQTICKHIFIPLHTVLRPTYNWYISLSCVPNNWVKKVSHFCINKSVRRYLSTINKMIVLFKRYSTIIIINRGASFRVYSTTLDDYKVARKWDFAFNEARYSTSRIPLFYSRRYENYTFNWTY